MQHDSCICHARSPNAILAGPPAVTQACWHVTIEALPKAGTNNLLSAPPPGRCEARPPMHDLFLPPKRNHIKWGTGECRSSVTTASFATFKPMSFYDLSTSLSSGRLGRARTANRSGVDRQIGLIKGTSPRPIPPWTDHETATNRTALGALRLPSSPRASHLDLAESRAPFFPELSEQEIHPPAHQVISLVRSSVGEQDSHSNTRLHAADTNSESQDGHFA